MLYFSERVICCRDGKLLVGGGRSRFLHVWSLDSQSLLRVIELPRKVTSVHQLDFLPTSFDAGSNKVSHMYTVLYQMVCLRTGVLNRF